MSGLYNVIFGRNPHAAALLEVLGLQREHFERFRDAFLSQGAIIVYTRCGGPNRTERRAVFERMRAHPQYISEADDAYDSTYCTFWFLVPPNRALPDDCPDIGPWDPSARWKEAQARLAAGDPELLERVRPTMESIARQIESGQSVVLVGPPEPL